MVKKKITRSVYALATLGALLQTTGAFAKIPSVAFKGFSKHYKKKAYDLVIGAASDTSGFIYDMRLFGNFKSAYDVHHKRDYINDSSDDPLWNAVKLLLPSPTGQLTTEQAIPINFGKNATPKSVALLQNFIHSLREGEVIDETPLMQDMIASFKPFKSTAEVPAGAVQAIRTLKNLKDTTISPIIKKQVSPQAWNPLNKDITNIIKKTSSDEEKKTEIIQRIQEYLRKKEEDDVKARKQAVEKEMLEKTLKPLLANLKQSIVNEKDSLYMPGTTEQVLSSFFCAHFNTQADIREYMENLDDRIVDKANLPQTDDYLKQEDLPGMAAKAEPLDLDEFYDLAEASIFTALTPYKDGTSLVSNGNTYRYDRKQDELRTADPTFADCAEKGAQHIMNILHYDHIKRDYDLKPIQAFVAQKEQESGVKNPYFKNYKEFYEKHSPASANAGDIESRSQWNRVVGDLNAFDDSLHIDYIKGSNELNAGFINFVRVFQKIFGLTLDALPTTSLQAQKGWLEKSLNTLFTTVNPNKIYQFDLSAVTEKDKDLSGSLGVIVRDRATQEELFSFNFSSVPNVHGEVTGLKTLKKVKERDYNADLKTHSATLHQGTTEEALWMVAPADVRNSKLTHPLYKLFNTQLADNDSKIAFLETIKANFAEWYKSFLTTPPKLQAFKNMLGNVLDEVSWEDYPIVQKISPVIMTLAQEENLKNTFFQKVKVLKFSALQETDVKKIEGLNSFKNLEELYLNNTKNLEELNLEDLTQLTTLHLGDSAIKGCRLKGLTKLKQLYLNGTKNLEELDLEDLTQLTALYLDGSAIKSSHLKGLNSLTNLQILSLSSTYDLEKLTLDGLSQLQSIGLWSSGIKGCHLKGLTQLKTLDLKGSRKLKELTLEDLTQLTALYLDKLAIKGCHLKGLPKLENLDLSDTNNLEELNLEGLPQLTRLSLVGSAIKDCRLKGLPNLKELFLGDNFLGGHKNLKELNLEGLPQLTTLHLGDSAIKGSHLKGINSLTNLKDLYLHVTENVEELDLKGLTQLTTLNLSYSAIKGSHLKGLNSLNNLKTLNLADTKNLEELNLEGLTQLTELSLQNSRVKTVTFNEDMKDLKLDLQGSGIKNRSQIKGIEHLDESNIRWK